MNVVTLVALPILFAQLPNQFPLPAQSPLVKVYPALSDEYWRLRKEGKPFVVVVGADATPINGLPSLREDAFPASKYSVILITKDGATRYGEDVTARQLRIAAGLEAEPLAAPFENIGPPRNADDDARAAGPWPKGMPFPKGMRRYNSARHTQESFRRFQGYLHAVSRSGQEEKWRVPGGMVGVRGWRSDLYEYLPSQPRGWVGRLDPADAVGVITHQVRYPDETMLMDVLSNTDTGEVFEVRVAEKTGGVWNRYRDYVNARARPDGYKVIRSHQCAECHNQAGDTAYGGVAVPGGDTVLSKEPPTLLAQPFIQG